MLNLIILKQQMKDLTCKKYLPTVFCLLPKACSFPAKYSPSHNSVFQPKCTGFHKALLLLLGNVQLGPTPSQAQLQWLLGHHLSH